MTKNDAVVISSDSDDWGNGKGDSDDDEKGEAVDFEAFGLAEDDPEIADQLQALAQHEKQWPRDYHACDIITCITALRKAYRNGDRKMMPAIFRAHFPGVRYVRQTCFDQQKRFRTLSHAARERALKAGRTPAGVWSVVMQDALSLKTGRRSVMADGGRAKSRKGKERQGSGVKAEMADFIEISDDD